MTSFIIFSDWTQFILSNPGLLFGYISTKRLQLMNQEHPNLAVLKQFDPTNIAGASEILAEDAVFHYFNPRLPDMEGDYVGSDGFQFFFEKIGDRSNGTFKVNPVFASAVGDELVFVQTKNTMNLENQQIEIDVVVIWRIVDGKITEVWDIPSAYTGKSIDLNI